MFDTLQPIDCSLQAPLSMEFSSQESWSELPLPSPGDLPDPGIEPTSPTLQAGCLLSEPPGKLRILEWVAIPFRSMRDLAGQGIAPMSPALADGFITTEPPGKPLKSKGF